MKWLMSTFVLCAALCALGMSAWAQQDVQSLKATVVKACEKDLKTYCSQVTPGEQRLLACVYAHEDKLSDSCTYALYQASIALDEIAQTVEYIGTSCHVDMQVYCRDVKVGKGRMLACLKDHESMVSEGCRTAVHDVSK